jgi:hypothetical protein
VNVSLVLSVQSAAMKGAIRKAAGIVAYAAAAVLSFLFVFGSLANGYVFAGIIISAVVALPCFAVWAYLDPENEPYSGEQR